MTNNQNFSAGSQHKLHALILDIHPHQEKDLIVSCLTAEFGKISCFARSARNSKRRFPPAYMQFFNHLLIDVKVPRETSLGLASFWSLESVELKNEFFHLRQSYARLEWMSLCVRLIRDMLPNDHSDPVVFRSLGRLLRDTVEINSPQEKQEWAWLFLSYWIWFSHHQGWGISFSDLELENENAQMMWKNFCLDSEFDVQRLLKILKNSDLKLISKKTWIEIYRTWSHSSALQWNFFEKWLGDRFTDKERMSL